MRLAWGIKLARDLLDADKEANAAIDRFKAILVQAGNATLELADFDGNIAALSALVKAHTTEVVRDVPSQPMDVHSLVQSMVTTALAPNVAMCEHVITQDHAMLQESWTLSPPCASRSTASAPTTRAAPPRQMQVP